MPWTAKSFAAHNHALHGADLGHAAHIANAVLKRSGNDGMAIAVANRWAQKRDAGGAVDPGYDPNVGIPQTVKTQNPLEQGMIQRYSSMPIEKLTEMGVMLGGSPQGAMIQRILAQKRAMTVPTPAIGADPAPQAPAAKRGGTIARRAGGGDMGGSPWWTKREATAGASGFLHGATPGRADQIETTAPAGAYVIPADVIAGLGEGNSLAGAHVMTKMLSTGPGGIPMPRMNRGMGPPRPPAMQEPIARGGGVRSTPASDQTPVLLSHGEYVVHPHHVTRIGGGDLKRGHAALDRFVRNMRTKQIKKLKSLPGPVKS